MSRALLLVAVLAVFGRPALAELPPLSKAQLEDQASHIVTGRVVEVFSTERQKQSPEFVDTLYAIELDVASAAKGDGIKPGQHLFVRTWKSSRRPRGWVGPGGQSVIPKPGNTVTVYLRNQDGGYEILIPNGLSVDKAGSQAESGQ